MTDKQIKKLNELTEMSQELGLYEDRPDWRITLQADHIKRLEEDLKAKEQECEELKDLANHNGRVCNERLDKIDELEHNINELNGQLDQLKAQLLDQEAETLKAGEIIHKLKQTLTEIKEIAEKYTKLYYADFKNALILILQKISEVEDEN